ncbi:MAG: DedA family protein [Alphaproteobacteria bacterium]|nr:DedA family protein [Alphaproteobacteria bacterium]
MLKRLYHWMLDRAASKKAVPSLAAVSFAESSFFPIPPDVMLIPMCLARPERAFYYAFICTLASVAGGVAGYAIGYLLYETVGQWIIGLYGYAGKMDQLRAFYDKWGWASVLIGGLTPVPFKLITILSGLLEYNLLLFVIFAVIARGARFFALAAVLYFWGDPIKAFIDRYFAALTVLFAVMLIGGFVVFAKLF